MDAKLLLLLTDYTDKQLVYHIFIPKKGLEIFKINSLNNLGKNNLTKLAHD